MLNKPLLLLLFLYFERGLSFLCQPLLLPVLNGRLFGLKLLLKVCVKWAFGKCDEGAEVFIPLLFWLQGTWFLFSFAFFIIDKIL